jgi:hypothetical protein
MDKNIKLLIYFLNYLTKKSKGQSLSEEEFKKIALTGGFKQYVDNINLFNFFNENVKENIDWGSFDLAPYINTFLQKIQLIYGGTKLPSEVFTNPIDDKFKLASGWGDYVDFYDEFIRFKFSDETDSILLDLINCNSDDMYNYLHARNGEAYRPEGGEDMDFFFRFMDKDNMELLVSISKSLGDFSLAKEIQSRIDSGTRLESNEINQILELLVRTGKKGTKLLRELTNEYENQAESASVESVKETFDWHFNNTGVEFGGVGVIDVKYETFINLLKENPQIKTFSDLDDVNLIQYPMDDLSDASYEYDLDIESLNKDFYYLLDNFNDVISNDEEIQNRVKSYEEIEKLMKILKFQYEGGVYDKSIKVENGNKHFRIDPNEIDFDEKTVVLHYADTSKRVNGGIYNKAFKIPFDEISDYVYTEKLLYEMIKMKIKKYLLKN